MKNKKMVKIVSNNPIDVQDSIKEYIGQEFEVIEWWKNKNNELEEGEVKVILKGESDPNSKNQPSILNKNEYEFI